MNTLKEIAINQSEIETSTSIETLSTISVDCVIFGYDDNKLKVLIRSENIPDNGEIYQEWKFPGNQVRRSETIEETSSRILKEQTGLENIYVKQFMVFSDPNRLRRKLRDYEWIRSRITEDRVITVGFYSLINVKDVD